MILQLAPEASGVQRLALERTKLRSCEQPTGTFITMHSLLDYIHILV